MNRIHKCIRFFTKSIFLLVYVYRMCIYVCVCVCECTFLCTHLWR
jgi:hypothetical protein